MVQKMESQSRERYPAPAGPAIRSDPIIIKIRTRIDIEVEGSIAKAGATGSGSDDAVSSVSVRLRCVVGRREFRSAGVLGAFGL